jgi:hypothetical protein
MAQQLQDETYSGKEYFFLRLAYPGCVHRLTTCFPQVPLTVNYGPSSFGFALYARHTPPLRVCYELLVHYGIWKDKPIPVM